MKEFSVTVLGSSAAIATADRNLTSHLVNHCNRFFLIDCGEGTQFRLRELKIKTNRIKHVFISHLHGDHFYGLIGLISTMHLMRRTDALTIHGPVQLENLIKMQLEASETSLYYPLNFEATNPEKEQIIYDDGKLQVISFPLKHRIPTTGFLLKEKEQPRHVNKTAADRYGVPLAYYTKLQQGLDYMTEDGERVLNSDVTHSSDAPRSYGYCSDTVYSEDIITSIRGCDLLYHESTFRHDLQQAAMEKMHSTNVQAALIAQKAEVKRLLLGHFSARYDNLEPLLQEARSVFPQTYLVEEGVPIQI